MAEASSSNLDPSIIMKNKILYCEECRRERNWPTSQDEEFIHVGQCQCCGELRLVHVVDKDYKKEEPTMWQKIIDLLQRDVRELRNPREFM